MTLTQATVGKKYLIQSVDTKDPALNHFLLTLGCFEGQTITLIATLKYHCIVLIKDARYSIDSHLANAIVV